MPSISCRMSHSDPEITRREPVSVDYRTSLRHAETEIEKCRPETGGAMSPIFEQVSEFWRAETEIRMPKPRECRQFSHGWKYLTGDWTGWLGKEDSNSQIPETRLTSITPRQRSPAKICRSEDDRPARK